MRPPARLLASPPPPHALVVFCTLQDLGTVCTVSHGEGVFAPGMHRVVEGGQQGRDVGQLTTAQAELPTICAWNAGTHSPGHRGENSAHLGPRDPEHCSPSHATKGAHSQQTPQSTLSTHTW